MFKLEESKRGIITIKYKNKYIHSKYDPIKEAENFAEGNIELLKSKVIVIYGIGLGYHVDSIWKRINKGTIIYVFEYNNELLKCCKKINKKLFENKDIVITSGEDKLFFKKLADALAKVQNIIIHKSSLETIKESNELLYNLINDFNIMKQYTDINEELNRQSEENYAANTEKIYKNINEFFLNIKDNSKPFVITSAGPSLDNDLELLKNNRELFNIITVGSALRSLTKKEIIPDAVVIIDTKPIVKKQFEDIDTKEIPLCFSAYASRWAVEYYKGQKYIFNTNEKDEIKTRGTVAVAAMGIAIKCGAENIIMLGQDLAFINKKSHTNTFEETYGFKDEYTSNLKMQKVKSVNGTMINTTQGYITFRNKIQSLIRESAEVKFINCSKGAYIEGAEQRSFEDVINKFKFR